MPTMEVYLTRPVAERLHHLRKAPEDLWAKLHAPTEAALSCRPAEASWSAVEIVCHLRDVEELFLLRFQTMLAIDDPKILTFSATPEALRRWGISGSVGHPLDPDGWAEDRQYQRADARAALAAFAKRRGELLALLDSLSPAQWERGGIHLLRGRMTLADWAASLAAHDDNHMDQLDRALAGRP